MRPEPLLILARKPAAGRSKTRLSPLYTRAEAARFATSFFRDTLALAGHLGHPAMVFGTGGSLAAFKGDAPAGTAWRTQGRGDLGARMEAAFQGAFGAGARRAVMLGTDSPGMPAASVRAAWRALRSCDVVLGPATDGGYYLIGLSRPAPELLRNMPWSTSSLLHETLQRARHLKLRVRRLPLWFDVDRAEDLHALAGLDALGALRPRPVHTLECIAALGLRGR